MTLRLKFILQMKLTSLLSSFVDDCLQHDTCTCLLIPDFSSILGKWWYQNCTQYVRVCSTIPFLPSLWNTFIPPVVHHRGGLFSACS